MCGILGVMQFDGQEIDRGLLLKMRDTMIHRGPDDAGVLVDGSVGLAHRRLSILDLSPTGHQPMSNEDSTLWLTFNGEIYNYVELRQELLRKGHRFSSTTDSEVILHLYEEHGDRCVERLNGMFAFLIWDSRRSRFFGARDRFGIKPFHFFVDESRFIAASEVKAIVEHPSVLRKVDYQGLSDYLFAGGPLKGRTCFQNVSELPPSHSITVEGGHITTQRYWDLEFTHSRAGTAQSLAGELAELIQDAVDIHCRSDAPLGSHLSGGLDSSTVAGFAARHVKDLKTFSIRMDVEGAMYDETHFARAVADKIGARWFVETATGHDFADLLPKLMWHMDQPAAGGGDAGYSYYCSARLAANHVKVALTGHGGDEIFAGYPAQFQLALGSTEAFQASAGNSGTNFGMRDRLTRVRGVGFTRSLFGAMNRRFRGTSGVSVEDQWASLHCGRPPLSDPSLHSEFKRRLGGYSPVDDYLEPFRNAPAESLLDRALYHDLRVYLPQLLHKEDRASMAVSIESRVPLLDPRIAVFASQLNQEQKIPEQIPKGLLRRAASQVLPEQVWSRRDKVPFAIPMSEWLDSMLTRTWKAVVEDPACLDRGIFNPDLIRGGSLTLPERRKILTVELWFRLFMDQDRAWLSQAGRD